MHSVTQARLGILFLYCYCEGLNEEIVAFSFFIYSQTGYCLIYFIISMLLIPFIKYAYYHGCVTNISHLVSTGGLLHAAEMTETMFMFIPSGTVKHRLKSM